MIVAVSVSLLLTWILATIVLTGAKVLLSPIEELPGGFPRAYTLGSLVLLALLLVLAGVMTIAKIPGSGSVLRFAAAVFAGIVGAWAGAWTSAGIVKFFNPLP